MAEGKIASIEDEPVRDGGDAPLILCDGYAGVCINAGVARFAFFVVNYDPVGKKNGKRHVLDLALPIGALMATHQAFGELIDDMQKKGLIQVAPPKQKLDS